MSIRSLRARRLPIGHLPISRLTVPGILVAATLFVGSADGPATPVSSAADQQAVASTGPLAPFAATPLTIPLQIPLVAAAIVRPHRVPPVASAPIATLPVHLDLHASSIPVRVLAAYVNAATLADAADAQCHLAWQTLAGIGFIESDHARSGGSANPHWNGVANPPILGPVLPDKVRAIGPMQFLPSTWAIYAADGNHDGQENPEDIDDATLGAADYLCAVAPDLNQPKHLIRAIFAYNHSYAYVRAVLTVTAHYMNINPAKLGINGLPKSPRRKTALHLATPVAPPPLGSSSGPTGSTGPQPTATPTASPTPTNTPSPSPSPSPSAKPTPRPTPTVSWSPRPSPSPSRRAAPPLIEPACCAASRDRKIRMEVAVKARIE